MNTQDWSPLGWTGWISLQSKGLSRVFSNTSRAIQNPERWCYQNVALNMSANLEDPAMATGKGQSSSQFPRRVVLKNVLTIRHLHLSPMLVRSCWKSCILGFSINMNQELPEVQVGFRRGRGTRDQVANIFWIIEKARESHKKYLLLLHWLW